jgi:hypothetical protein
MLAPAASTLLGEIGSIVDERFPSRLDALLPVRYRMTARAVRTRDRRLLGAGAALLDGIRSVVETRAVAVEGSRLDLSVQCSLVDPAGDPLRFANRDGQLAWVPPPSMEGAGALESGDLMATSERDPAAATLVLRHRPSQTMFEQAVAWQLQADEGWVLAAGSVDASIDLGTVAAGGPLSRGTWDLFVNLSFAGFGRRPRVPGGEPAPIEASAPASAYVTNAGNLAVTVRRSDGAELVVAPPIPESKGGPRPRSLRQAAFSILPGPAKRAARAVLHELRP